MFRFTRVTKKLQFSKLICRTKSSKRQLNPAEAPKPINTPPTQTDIAVLCANAGLVLTAFTYMNQDMFHLRLTAIGSLAMTMISQHRLKQTALFRWNVLFMGINAAWILTSFYEESLSGEHQDVYMLLQERGDMISEEDFKKIFKAAKREVRNRGDLLMSEGFACKEM